MAQQTLVTLRSEKGSPLTINEVDDNFRNLSIDVGLKLYESEFTATNILNLIKTVDTNTSGLNASTLKGLEPLSTNTVSSVVSRDTSGNFSANVITANSFVGTLEGNATGLTATLPINKGGTGATSESAALNNLLPAGEVSGYVLKTAGPGTYYWALETGATVQSGTRIDTTRVFYTATAGQTVFTSTGTYTPGANQLRVYINGVRQFNSAYTETSSTSFTLATGVTAGTQVMAEVDAYISYNIPASSVSNSPAGNISSTTVQNAINELDNEKAPAVHDHTSITGSAASISNSNGWSIVPSATKVSFVFNGVTVVSIDTSGNIVSSSNVTAYGAP